MNEELNFAGKNGFTWWVGTVENRQDPLKLGRCRVRCFGWHSPNKNLAPTKDLPWAVSSIPINANNVYPPREGDMVFGFFLDGNNAQEPVMLGSFPGIPIAAADPQSAFSDPRLSSQLDVAPKKPNETEINYPRQLDEPTTSRLARNDDDYPSHINESKTNNRLSKVEPSSTYAAQYPYNNVYESESGHAMEFDDTRNNERVHIYHRSGSYLEYAANGDRTERANNNSFSVTVGNDSVYIVGNATVFIDGNLTATVGGNLTATVEGEVTATASKFKLIGDVEVTGSITASGTITDSGATLATHTHGGVQSGGSSTGVPN